jgi:hypothetical protein
MACVSLCSRYVEPSALSYQLVVTFAIKGSAYTDKPEYLADF